MDRCLGAVDALMKRMATRSDSELDRRLERAKRQYLGQIAIGSENRENRVMGSARHALYFGKLADEEAAVEAIKAVSPAQIKALAEKLLSPARLIYT